MDRQPAPPLLPILRSRQQAELLTLLLSDPEVEASVSDLATRTGIPYASVHREVERAQSAGLLESRRIGRTRLIRADTTSPYFQGLADVLTKAFGPPRVLAEALAGVEGVTSAFVFGSWAARFQGRDDGRPVGDIDLLVLGEPDRDVLYVAVAAVEERLGRQIGVTLRPANWLETGSGPFHDTVTSRPLIPVIGDGKPRSLAQG